MAVGEGMRLLHAGPAPLWSAVVGIGLSMLLIRGSFDTVANVFKWLCLSLFTYVAVLFAVHITWSDVLKGFVGLQLKGDASYWRIVVAILGTTISPYLFFWQSAHRIEKMREDSPVGQGPVPLRRRPSLAARNEERESRFDVFTGMLFSQLVMVAIIVATGATIGQSGNGDIASAADAAKALEPLAGSASTVLFAVGFIGAGVLSIPVLAASASVGLAGLTGKEWGFERSPRRAPVFYGLVLLGTVGGTVLAVVMSNPISLLVLSAFVNGIASAPFLVVTMLVAGDRTLMGEYRNGRLASTLGWAAVAVMTTAALIGLVQTVLG
jgi:Mn2+/Fe2+ NRAMP family transporter